MMADMCTAFDEAAKDRDTRAIILTGAGKAFCAGLDMTWIDDAHVESRHEVSTLMGRMMGSGDTSILSVLLRIRNMPKPVIAAVNGAAVGGGFNLALGCDIRIASEKAKFSMAYVRLGMPPAGGGGYFLPRIVGIAKACELIWTGRMIDAEEALRIGYVSKVVAHDELEAATKELATKLAKGPTVAIRLAKRLIYRCLDLDLVKALEDHQTAMLIAQGTEDAREGPLAFVEKREPIFKGR